MSKDAEIQGVSTCPRCGGHFACGMQAGHAKCWCADLPHLPPPDPGTGGCYCPECLHKLLAPPGEQPH